MKILENPRISRPAFGIRPNMGTDAVKNTARVVKENKIADAFKLLTEKFKNVTEVGKFEKIVIPIEQPLNSSSVPKAKLIIEPSSNKNDFRTRVLTFLAYSPFEEEATRSVAQATGNNFAIGAVLKDSSTVSAFKTFIKDSERYFFTNFSR